jgi:hypothetical protein
MDKTIKIDLRIIKSLPEGRWIYTMPFPDKLPKDYK